MDHTEGAVGLLDRDATEPAADAGAGQPDPTTGETIFTRQVRYMTAICSFAASLLHILAMTAHADHHPTVGRAFFAVAVIQFVWGVLLMVDPRRLFVVLGALATAGAIVVWVFSRTKGISWFPGLGDVEPLEWRDVVTQFFQLLALVGAAIVLLPAKVYRTAGARIELIPIAVFAVLTMGTLAVLYAATYNYVHH